MKQTTRFILVPLLIATSSSFADATDAPRVIPAVRASTPPVIDGMLDDDCWSHITSSTDFVMVDTNIRAVRQTFGYVCYDDDHLYVAMKCMLPPGIKPKGRTQKEVHLSLWGDENVKVMLDPGFSRTDYYMFELNPYGLTFDRMVGPGGRNDEWHGDWRAETSVADGYWVAEFAIPFTDLANSEKIETTWGINLCREAPFEFSSISTDGNFYRARNFAVLKDIKVDFNEFRKDRLTIGRPQTSLDLAQTTPRLTISMPLTNHAGRPRSVNVQTYFAFGDEGGSKSETIKLDANEVRLFPIETENTELHSIGSKVVGWNHTLVQRTSDGAYGVTYQTKIRKVIVSDTRDGSVLATFHMSKRVKHDAMTLIVNHPWHRNMTDAATSTVSCTVNIDVFDPQREAGQLEVSLSTREKDQVVARQTIREPAKTNHVSFSARDLPWGAYRLRASFTDAHGAKRFSTKGPTAILPGGKHRIKVLNNLVSELMNAKQRGLLDKSEIAFMNPRDGWCYFSIEGDAVVHLDGIESAILPAAWGDPYEAMRYLKAGRHTLRVTSKDGELRQIIVRAIPALQYDLYGAPAHLTAYGMYDWEFLRKQVLPNINVMISVHGLPPAPEHIEAWKDLGRRWVRQENLPVHHNVEIDPTAEDAVDEVYAFWAKSPGFQDPRMDGVILDEFNSRDRLIFEVYRKALRRVQTTFPDRTFLPYWGSKVYADQSLLFAAAALDHGGSICAERYLREMPTEAAAKDEIERGIPQRISKWQQMIPGINPRVRAVLFLNSAPPESVNLHPNASFRAFMDMQVQSLATAPALFGIGGVQWYRASYSDEENIRWIGKLFRHYCIEGNAERASPDPYDLTHIQNPDFVDGTDGWEIDAAEPGAIWPARHYGLGKLQGRATMTGVGSSFVVTRRSGDRPNAIRQRIKNLEPGRLYSMKMITGDYQDLINGNSAKKVHGVSIELEHTQAVPGPTKSFQYLHRSSRSIDPMDKFKGDHPYWINYHWHVFRAEANTARLTVSDWKNKDEPGGPLGQELLYHFIEIQPYFAD